MSYKKAIDILPRNILSAVQQYIDGEYIYIPRKEDKKQAWGEIHRQEKLSRRETGKFCPDVWQVALLQN